MSEVSGHDGSKVSSSQWDRMIRRHCDPKALPLHGCGLTMILFVRRHASRHPCGTFLGRPTELVAEASSLRFSTSYIIPCLKAIDRFALFTRLQPLNLIPPFHHGEILRLNVALHR